MVTHKMNSAINSPIGCWMLKVFSILVVLIFSEAQACKLKREIVSLSAPVSGVLRELGLLKDPQLKAVSLFHPFTASEFAGERLGGGLFLSKREMQRFKHATFYFDQSAELSKRLKELSLKHLVQIRTRGQDPFAITRMAVVAISENLAQCETQLGRLEAWLKSEQAFLQQQVAFQGEVFFFLGEIRNDKWPQLMIVKDGPILFWLNQGKLKTFDTPLSYVAWGEKWKASLKGTERMVGLVQTKPEQAFRLERLSKNQFNALDPMSLSPGPWQIHFMHRFVGSFK